MHATNPSERFPMYATKKLLLTAAILLWSTCVRGVEVSDPVLAASAAAAMAAWEGESDDSYGRNRR